LTPLFERIEERRAWREDERLVLDSVRRLAAEVIAPRAEAYDRSGEFPADNIAAINALGLNGLFVPEAYGGNPISYRLYLACVREISAASARSWHSATRNRSSACCRALPMAASAPWSSPSRKPAPMPPP
jgi:alkylation response protein AidB-like acyl-CoA dehydrogenase